MSASPPLQTLTRRLALPEDETFLRRLHDSTRMEEMTLFPGDDAAKSAFLAMQFRARQSHYQAQYPHAQLEILSLGNEPAGSLRVDPGSDAFLVVEIALLPHWRGQGLGGAVLQEVIAQAAAARVPVRLHVEIRNPAQRLYARLGFVPIHDDGMYLLMERPL